MSFPEITKESLDSFYNPPSVDICQCDNLLCDGPHECPFLAVKNRPLNPRFCPKDGPCKCTNICPWTISYDIGSDEEGCSCKDDEHHEFDETDPDFKKEEESSDDDVIETVERPRVFGIFERDVLLQDDTYFKKYKRHFINQLKAGTHFLRKETFVSCNLNGENAEKYRKKNLEYKEAMRRNPMSIIHIEDVQKDHSQFPRFDRYFSFFYRNAYDGENLNMVKVVCIQCCDKNDAKIYPW